MPSNPLVQDDVIMDADKVGEAVQRCIVALGLIARFEATDESIQVFHPRLQRRGRAYPAGYVEDLIAEIKTALTGQETDAEADTV